MPALCLAMCGTDKARYHQAVFLMVETDHEILAADKVSLRNLSPLSLWNVRP